MKISFSFGFPFPCCVRPVRARIAKSGLEFKKIFEKKAVRKIA
jgi:hypothetical protein